MIIEIACPMTPAVESVMGQIVEAGQGFQVDTTSEGFPGLQCRRRDECDNFDCPFHGAIMFTQVNGAWAEEGDPDIGLMENPDEDEDDEDEEDDDNPYYDEDEDEDEDDDYEVIDEGGGSVVDEISGTIGGIFGESVGDAVKEEIEGGMKRVGKKVVGSLFDNLLGEEKKPKDDEPDDDDIIPIFG